MVWTFKITNGSLTFTNGQVDMIGVKDGFSLPELLQRLSLRFLTFVLSDHWHPLEGFDFPGITNNKYKYEQSGIGIDSVIRQVAATCIMQDPDVASLDSIDVTQENDDISSRNWIVRASFHPTNEMSQVQSFYTGMSLGL